MRLSILVLVASTMISTVPCLAQPDNIDELAANPKYMEEDVKPTFHKVTFDQLQKGVKVVSGRSYAVFGFNTPEVQVHFPAFDNNAFASVKFSKAVLTDSNGNEVAYESEGGGYDHDDLVAETRFVSEDYDSLIEYSVAKGKAKIDYPAEMHTETVKASGAADKGIIADGAYVKVYDFAGVAEEATFSPIEALRAYDAKGKRLERYQGWGSGGGDERGAYIAFAYNGVPARFDFDVVDKWIGLEIDYIVRAAPLWPESRSGLAPDDKFENTVAGDVEMREFRVIPSDVLGWYADMAEEDLLEQLAQYRYREFSEQNMVLAATQGETDAVRIMLAAGVTPDAVASNGRALINAAAFGQDETAILLIRAGADVNAVDETNSSALLRATNRCGNGELIQALIDAGADVNVQAKGSATPMMMATVMQCEENQKILKAAGAKEWKPGQ